MEWHAPRDTDHWAYAAPIGRRGLTNARREQRTEAAEAREADFHADVRHRVLAGREQMPGEIEPGCLAEVVRRGAEHCLELADQNPSCLRSTH